MKTTLYIHPDYDEKLKDFVTSVAERGLPPKAEVIYKGRNTIYKIEAEGIKLNIKSFRRPSFPNSYIYTTLRKSKARRSFENAETLLRRDIPTPHPVGWIENKHGARLAESYYISLQSPYSNNLRFWETWKDTESRDRVLTEYVRFMAKIHEKGIHHHDLSPGNVLWSDDHGEINFQLVDLNRMTIHNRPLKEKERYSNFRNINLIESETEHLGRLYGLATGNNPTLSGTKALNALRKDRKSKRRLRAVKNFFRHGTRKDIMPEDKPNQ